MKRNGWLAATLIAAGFLMFAVGGCGVADRVDEDEAADAGLCPSHLPHHVELRDGAESHHKCVRDGVKVVFVCKDGQNVDFGEVHGDRVETCPAPEPSAPADDDEVPPAGDTTIEVDQECPEGQGLETTIEPDGTTTIRCEREPIPPPVEEPSAEEEPPPVIMPPAGPTVAVEQDADRIRISLYGDFRNLGAWQTETGLPLPSDADLSVCTLAPSSAATGWDGTITAGAALAPMSEATPTIVWAEDAAPSGNCAGAADGAEVTTEQVVITFRVVCPGGQMYWPDPGAWTRIGGVFVYWADNNGDWRGGICRAAPSD